VKTTTSNIGRMVPMALAIASTFSFAALDAQEHPASLRGLLGDAGMVLRGVPIDQASAPGGLWHRFRVDELVWSDGSSSPEAGTVLRLYSHGAGIPEGGDLPIGEEVIVGATAIPADADSRGSSFLRRLSESLRASAPGEAAALASPDGMIVVTGDPGGADAVGRMVRGLRDGVVGTARSEMLLELTSHRLPAVRAEAVRQLGLSPTPLDASTAFRAAEALREEAEGPSHPSVLAAHMDLLEGRDDGIGGSALVRVIRSSTDPAIARRAGILLDSLGSPADWMELAGSFAEVKTSSQVSVLGALSSCRNPRSSPVFARALESPDRKVRIAAVSGLRGNASPAALRMLREAGGDPAPEVRAAAIAAQEVEGEGRVDDPGSLRNVLRSVRAHGDAAPPPEGNAR
jgi:hypothetical protein